MYEASVKVRNGGNNLEFELKQERNCQVLSLAEHATNSYVAYAAWLQLMDWTVSLL